MCLTVQVVWCNGWVGWFYPGPGGCPRRQPYHHLLERQIQRLCGVRAVSVSDLGLMKFLLTVSNGHIVNTN